MALWPLFTRIPNLPQQVSHLSREISEVREDAGGFAGPRVQNTSHNVGSATPLQSTSYFSTSISGYFRLTAATTVACSGFPLDRASASRACAASSIG